MNLAIFFLEGFESIKLRKLKLQARGKRNWGNKY